LAEKGWDLNAELKRVAALLERKGLRYAVCGGMAVSLYSEPRATVDLDLVIDPADLEKVMVALKEIGFESFSAPMNFKGGEMIIHRVLKLEPEKSQVLMLDLCMPDKSKFPRVWKDWKKIDLGDYSLTTLSREGLIEMKRSRGSEKDLLDIRNLEETE